MFETATGACRSVLVPSPSWPRELLPQHATVPPSSSAQAWLPPTASAANARGSGARSSSSAAPIFSAPPQPRSSATVAKKGTHAASDLARDLVPRRTSLVIAPSSSGRTPAGAGECRRRAGPERARGGVARRVPGASDRESEGFVGLARRFRSSARQTVLQACLAAASACPGSSPGRGEQDEGTLDRSGHGGVAGAEDRRAAPVQ